MFIKAILVIFLRNVGLNMLLRPGLDIGSVKFARLNAFGWLNMNHIISSDIILRLWA